MELFLNWICIQAIETQYTLYVVLTEFLLNIYIKYVIQIFKNFSGLEFFPIDYSTQSKRVRSACE
jgi:hypothetical protein